MPERQNVVLAMGRLTDQKGFDLLLQAWARLGKARDRWCLRIVGSGRNEAELKRLARQLQVTDSVTFVGLVRQVEREFRSASIYVMSSRWEGLGMTLLEAQHFGLPCVSTDCPVGPREILGGKKSGLLVPADDAQALADSMACLMRDPELRSTMGQAALANAAHYRPEQVWSQWQELFDDLQGLY
jgi:glycosyltransferase involved in cell wall biosynthesis